MPQDSSRLSRGVFFKLSVDEFEVLLDSTTLSRKIDAVHLHHTWRPRHRDFKGAASVVAMWKFHTQDQGWSDIAQHLTIDPEGSVWTGRHWDSPPASAKGFNGSPLSGPFMIEIVGDFDAGQDPFEDPQRGAVLRVTSLLLEKFSLPTSVIRFHNEMSSKSCPGAIDRTDLMKAVDKLRTKRGRSAKPAAESPFSSKDDALTLAHQFLRAAEPSVAERVGAFTHEDGELFEAETVDRAARTRASIDALSSASREVRDVDVALSPAVKESLKPYVVNLSNGKFSTTGEFKTSKADVDTIFDEHLAKALAESAGTPLRIVVFAHGGLVGEKDGLGVALKHVDWWRANGVYPIYFVWETGLLSTLINVIRQELAGSRALDQSRDAADVFDALVESAARRAQANRIWRDMKHVAELSSAAEGGARYVAQRLGQFCAVHGSAVEVHAIGHSAGANFHSFFVPQALDAGVPLMRTLQFLAPAITVDAFFSTFGPVLGRVGPMTMFTMKDSFEQDDNCAGVYNKSLLYLIFHCLEDAREADLLGLERSVRSDLRLKRMFGLDGTASPRKHEVVWSITTGDRRASSESTRHGGFDDDPATMNSVLRRVLDLSGDDEVAKEFVAPARAVDVDVWSQGGGVSFVAAEGRPTPILPSGPAPLAPLDGTRRYRALCVGINAYKRNPLNGCVADAERWAETLRALEFDVRPIIRDAQATRAGILAALDLAIEQSARGDVLVFQFAGHGTTLRDASGDEAGGDSPGLDEALCPYDFTEGQFIIDDDLGAVFTRATEKGVHLTSFIDCCHSGTISRLGVGTPVESGRISKDDRPRFIEPLPTEIKAHQTFRARLGASRPAVRSRGEQSDVLFSACRSTEVAWESAGQGDFTRHATAVLRRGRSITNSAFVGAVEAAFGAQPRQHPELHPSNAAGLRLFGDAPVATSQAPLKLADLQVGSTAAADAATLLRTIADLISR